MSNKVGEPTANKTETNNVEPTTTTNTTAPANTAAPANTTTTDSSAWIQPYYKMDKEELLAKVDRVTLNQIRNTLGDQKFIDQWKLSEAEYNTLIGDETHTETVETIPATNVYTSGTYGGVTRRVYGNSVYGSRYPGGYIQGSHYGGYPYTGSYGGSYYGGYPYSTGVTRYAAPVETGLRRSIVRADVPTTTYISEPVETNLRSSYIRTEAPRYVTEAPRYITSEAPVTRYLATEAPVTRIVDNTLRGSIVRAEEPIRYIGTDRTSVIRTEAPVTRYITGDNTLRSSYVGAPVSYLNAPVSYVRGGATTLRNSSYVSGGHYPITRSYINNGSYYPTTTRVVGESTSANIL